MHQKNYLSFAFIVFLLLLTNFATYFFTLVQSSPNTPPRPFYELSDPTYKLKLKIENDIYYFSNELFPSQKIFIKNSSVNLDKFVNQFVNFKGNWQNSFEHKAQYTSSQCIVKDCRQIFGNKNTETNGVDISDIWIYDPLRPGNIKLN